MTAFVFILTPWLDYVAVYPSDGGSSFIRGSLCKVLTLITGLIIACLVGYSRIFLARHSVDQVLYGALMGAWIALTSHYLIRDRFFSQAKSLLNGSDRRFSFKLALTLLLFLVTFTVLICVT